MIRTGWLDNKAAKTGASILLAFFLLYRALVFYLQAFHGFAWDFSVNWTAALGLREGLSVYDRAALQQLAIARVDDGMRALFNGRFTSFVGLPTTAMLHLPFSYLPLDAAIRVYRLLSLLGMMLAITLTGLSLPAPQRLRAWLAGMLCLLCWHAFPLSLQLGQVDAWVMLALATAVFAASRLAWVRAGVAIGLAVLLKISPGWLLLYGLWQRQWLLLLAAGAAVATGLLLSLLAPHVGELTDFFTRVLPALGDSPLHVQNQSLGAVLARLATSDVQLLSFAAGIDGWKIVAAGVAGALLLVYRQRQGKVATPEGLAFAVLPALLAGPLSWDHYLGWAVIPVMLFAARLHYRHWPLLALPLLPLVFPVPYPAADAVAAHAGWRLLTGLQALGLLAVAVWMIASVPGQGNNQPAARVV